MSIFQFVFSSLRHYWRSNLAVALGVAAATVTLTGALLVGDSVRGSLRWIALDRLGQIDEVLVTDRFFRVELAAEVAGQADFPDEGVAEPVILLQGSVKNPSSGNFVSNVNVMGCRPAFWNLGSGGPTKSPSDGQIVVNTQLASELGVQVGDSVNLQIGQASAISGDSPLGRKTDTIRRKQLSVSEVVPTDGLGRFGLHPSQQLPANAFVAVETIQAMLDKPNRVNAILIASKANIEQHDVSRVVCEVRPTLADYGLRLDEVRRQDDDRTVTHYFNLTSERMLLDPTIVEAARRAWREHQYQEVLTYLANWIATDDQKIPYSTVTAVDSIEGLGPLLDDDGQPLALRDDGIAVTDWATKNQHLSVTIGDPLTITFFQPDTTHGQVSEDDAHFRAAAIFPLGGDGQPITLANDPAFTPDVPGVTDQKSIDDWDPPFPFDASRIRDDRDDAYWQKYRATPKAFVSLSAGRKLWSSRFGDTTSIRVLAGSNNRDELARQLLAEIAPETLGFKFQPIKRQALQAASGTTPFDVLFLMFSAFLIAAALMLVALLFRLGIEQRITDVGLMTAVGFASSRVGRTLATEGLVVATAGALLGTVAGLGYAALILVGLRTWWVDAVSTPFLQLHTTTTSLVIGFLGGLIVCGLAILWTLRRATRLAPTRLLTGKIEDSSQLTITGTRWSRWTAIVALLLACVLIPVAMRQGSGGGGEIQAGIFFAAGALVLLAGLLWIRDRLRAAGSSSVSSHPAGVWWLAERNAARNPGRSTLTVGLVAAASFVIIAVSAFRLDDTNAGGGGYNLIGQSAAPLYYDLTSEEGQFQLGIDQATAQVLDASDSVALRVRPGQDASCLNLYRPDKPRVLGVPAQMSTEFMWASRGESSNNPWESLDQSVPEDSGGVRSVPVILDQNTAMYSLRLWKGVGDSFTMETERGATVRLVIAALLKNSIFQGDVLMSEENFLDLFPSAGGYRYFLVKTPTGEVANLQTALENRLADYGFDVITTRSRLRDLFAVQNTYLSTFQTLGGLGLVLGTLGLAAVQLRNVLVRRGELALMRAAGFRHLRLASVVMMENGFLLLTGLGIGIAAAVVAVMPHLLAGGARLPWASLAGMLVLVVVVGMITGLAAVRSILRAPLIGALRGD